MAEHFHALTVADKVAETADAFSIRFAVPDALAETFRFQAGQHLTLRAMIDGAEVRRNYSLSAAPMDGALTVTVKRIAGGLFSNWVCDRLAVGDTIDVMPPHGSFTHAPGTGQRLVGIAGGSGITPVISIVRTVLAQDPTSRVTLLYGNRDAESVIFLEALAGLKDRYLDRFQLYHFLSDEAGDVPLFHGMLDRATCETAIASLVADPAGVDGWFICGPGPMMDAAEAALADRGIARERIHVERFTAGRPSAALAAAMQQAQAEASGVEMTVTLDGRTKTLAFNGANILDSAREAGLAAPYACKAGVCATCRARVIQGEVDMAVHYGLSEDEVAAGYVLTCQAVPRGPGVVLDYDA